METPEEIQLRIDTQLRIDQLELLGEDRSEDQEIELASLATKLVRFEAYGEPID